MGILKIFLNKYLQIRCILLYIRFMKKGAKKERNGKVYIAGWVDKDIEKKARTRAKEDKRTFTAYLEIALFDYNER